MEQIPVERTPKKGTEGARYRARQLFFQLPRQDYSPKYAKFLKEEAKPSFFDLCKDRSETAVGIGMLLLCSNVFHRILCQERARIVAILLSNWLSSLGTTSSLCLRLSNISNLVDFMVICFFYNIITGCT